MFVFDVVALSDYKMSMIVPFGPDYHAASYRERGVMAMLPVMWTHSSRPRSEPRAHVNGDLRCAVAETRSTISGMVRPGHPKVPFEFAVPGDAAVGNKSARTTLTLSQRLQQTGVLRLTMKIIFTKKMIALKFKVYN